jgi:transcription elongation GreA/GreB family factor
VGTPEIPIGSRDRNGNAVGDLVRIDLTAGESSAMTLVMANRVAGQSTSSSLEDPFGTAMKKVGETIPEKAPAACWVTSLVSNGQA